MVEVTHAQCMIIMGKGGNVVIVKVQSTNFLLSHETTQTYDVLTVTKMQHQHLAETIERCLTTVGKDGHVPTVEATSTSFHLSHETQAT